MDIKRVILFGALAFVAFSLWNDWQIDYPQKPSEQTQSVQSAQSIDEKMLPNMTNTSVNNDNNFAESLTQDSSKSLVKVKTDVLDLTIDLKQGNVIGANLIAYPEDVKKPDTPFVLLQDNKGAQYVANSSLFAVNNQKIENFSIDYTSDNLNYELAANDKDLAVTLTGKLDNGLEVTKEYLFKRGSYLIDMQYKIANTASAPVTLYMNTQLYRSSPKEDKTSMFHMGSFTGASYSVPGQSRYKKLTFKDIGKNNLDVESVGGWIAMQQHYFLTAWIPNVSETSRFYTKSAYNDYTIGNVSAPITIEPSATKSLGSKLYLGPEITETLKQISPGLDLTVDYGWLWFISQLLFSIMKSIYNVIGNWGFAIVLVTVFIKLAFYKLSAKSYKSMAGMRNLQPKIQSIRERFGDDKAKMSQATMELYRQEKVNPLGGCLPILIQIPVFIALYWVLVESVELRQADFIFWIHDLASPDPYHVLPIIMGLTMFIQQKLNPAPPDPMQAKVMMFLPVVFTILFLNFPVGLVLYWTINNSLSILQQWYITRKYGDAKGSKKLTAVKK
jgi:YidC/Oxa1 family membrane protein insertase